MLHPCANHILIPRHSLGKSQLCTLLKNLAPLLVMSSQRSQRLLEAAKTSCFVSILVAFPLKYEISGMISSQGSNMLIMRPIYIYLSLIQRCLI